MMEEIIRPTGIIPFPYKAGYEMAPGDRCDLVSMLQMMLCELKIYYDVFGDVVSSGVYDVATESAISAYQSACGMETTGRVDVVTWNRLAEEYNAAVCEDQ